MTTQIRSKRARRAQNETLPLVHKRDVAGAPQRFRFIDALRGIAALLVACHHIDRYRNWPEPTQTIIPEPIITFFENGGIGVPIFFVISGFVIAYSLRKSRVTPGFLANYALRRSVRLDPAYWVTIGCVLVVTLISPWLGIPSPVETSPTVGQLVAHVFYLQNILGYENLSAGFWTLCIEMQFYLVFVALLGVAQRLSRRGQVTGASTHITSLIVIAPFALSSLFVFSLDRAYEHWFLYYFWTFSLGAILWWTLDGGLPRQAFWAFMTLIFIRLCWSWNLRGGVAWTTALTIYLVARAGHLGDWLNFRPLQYLGRISYSLYLIHFSVSHLVIYCGFKATGDGPFLEIFWLAMALGLSLVAAQLLNVLVETPSMRLSAKLGHRPIASAMR